MLCYACKGPVCRICSKERPHHPSDNYRKIGKLSVSARGPVPTSSTSSCPPIKKVKYFSPLNLAEYTNGAEILSEVHNAEFAAIIAVHA